MQPLFQEIKDLKVCILSEKLQLSQQLSSSLRKHGIMPSFFDSIHSFWTSCLHQKVDVAIIDNALLENSGVSLKDHPRIKNKQVNIIVTYEEPSLVRTELLTEMQCLGLLSTAQGIDEQIGILLQQAKQIEALRLNSRQLIEQRERLRHRNSLLVENFESSQKFCDEFMFMQNIIEQVDQKLELGFANAIESVFNELSFVKKFFIVGSNSTKKQLVSLSRNNKKSYKFQNLWEDNLVSGIHDKALERILIQAQDQLGGDIVALRVFNDLEADAEMVIVLSILNKAQSLMPWRVLEEQLSMRLSSLELRALRRVEQSNTQDCNRNFSQNLWELAQKLETNQNNLKHNNLGLIEVNLAGLISFIDQNTQISFSWAEFKRDFQLGLSRVLGKEVHLLENGVKSFVLEVERELISEQFNLVEDFCEFYEYWRYFSDSHIVISSELIPRIHVVANTTKFLTQSFSEELPNLEVSHGYQERKSEKFSFDWEPDFAQ